MIRVGIIEDDELFLGALKGFLEREPDIEVVGQANDIETGVAFGTEFGPMDVLLVDCCLEHSAYDGVQVARRILEGRKDPIKMIFLTSIEEQEVILQAYAAGASQYVLKSRFQELPFNIRKAVQGGTDPMNTLLEEFRRLAQEQALSQLTSAEREIFNHLQQGRSRSDIAELLGKSEETIKSQIKAILRKLESSSTKEAVEKVKNHNYMNQR
jgi:RNA polymerase sigma factor (sigma-70 family)